MAEAAGSSPLKRVKTDVLEMAYAESGPAGGLPVILLHGWPYDIHAFDDAEIEALNARLGYTEINDAHDAAVDRVSDERDVLIKMPAPDGEALLWKLDWLLFSDNPWEDHLTDQAHADARRYLGAATH